MAGSPCCGHSGSLASGADFHCATASREGRCDGENAGEPPIECAGGAALVRQGAERPSAGRAPFARVDAFPAAIGKVDSAAALPFRSLLLGPMHRTNLG